MDIDRRYLNAPADEAEAIGADELRQGQVLWTSIDSPWLLERASTSAMASARRDVSSRGEAATLGLLRMI